MTKIVHQHKIAIGDELQKSESSLIYVIIAEGSTNAVPVFTSIGAHFCNSVSLHSKNVFFSDCKETGDWCTPYHTHKKGFDPSLISFSDSKIDIIYVMYCLLNTRCGDKSMLSLSPRLNTCADCVDLSKSLWYACTCAPETGVCTQSSVVGSCGRRN